jgi:branched-chain amino acid transport system permease protein
MIGTWGALTAVGWLGIQSGDPAKTGFALIGVILVALIVAMAFSGAGAVILELVAYRPLRRRGSSRLAALISAIGASLFLQELWATEVFGTRDYEKFPTLMDQTVVFHLFDAAVRNIQIVVIVAALVMMVVLDRFVNGTRLGRGIRAVAQDPETATLMGVNINRVVTLTFLLGGIMAGAAGLLFELFYGTTRYDIGFILGVKAFTAAVLGGIGNLRGALLGGFLLGVIENYGGAVFGSQWKDVVAFTVLVVVLMFRPTGLLGESLGRSRA